MWMNAVEVAQYTGCCYKRVREWAKNPDLNFPAYYPPKNKKQWKVDKNDLDRWIRRTWRTPAKKGAKK